MEPDFQDRDKNVEVWGNLSLDLQSLEVLENIARKIKVKVLPGDENQADADNQPLKLALEPGYIKIFMSSDRAQGENFVLDIALALAKSLHKIAQDDRRFRQNDNPFHVWLEILEERQWVLGRASHELEILGRLVPNPVEASYESVRRGTFETTYGSACHQIAISLILENLLDRPCAFCQLNWPFRVGRPTYHVLIPREHNPLDGALGDEIRDEIKHVSLFEESVLYFIPCINRSVVINSSLYNRIFKLTLTGFMRRLLNNFYDIEIEHDSLNNPLFCEANKQSRYPRSFLISEDIPTNLASLMNTWATAFEQTFKDQKRTEDFPNILGLLKGLSDSLKQFVNSEVQPQTIANHAHEILHLVAFINGFCECVFTRMGVKYQEYPFTAAPKDQLQYTINKFEGIFDLFTRSSSQLTREQLIWKAKFLQSLCG